MNLIFLDVDGVLNSESNARQVYKQTHKKASGYSYPFDKKCLENLYNLVLKTNSELIITSTWRKNITGLEILYSELRKYNLDKYVTGYTPILNKTRGIEIKQFLSKLKYEPNFIILDDESSDMEDLLSHLIKTNREFGLTIQDVEKAIIKLNKYIDREK